MKNYKLKYVLSFIDIIAFICLVYILLSIIFPKKINNNITYLDISLETSNLTIKSGKSFNIKCKSKKTSIEIEDNKAIIKENSQDNIVITIPESTKFDQVYLYLGKGEAVIDYLETDFFDLREGTKVDIKKLIVNNKMGINDSEKVEIKDSIINNLDLFVFDNNININGMFKGKTEINGGTGNLNINLKDNDYYYELSNIEGSLTINNYLIKKENNYGTGKKKIAIDGNYGKIKITTEE